MSDELPEGWAEATLGDVITGFEAGRNLRAKGGPAGPGECGVLKISAVTWGSFRPEENKALLPGDEPKPHERVRNGDLLITRANTSDLVGAVVLVERDHPQLMLPDKILRLRPKDATIDRRYLLQALRTQTVREHFERNATGTSESMRNLSQPKMAAAPITLAPLPEQHRIVTAVEALLEQVNRARERLDRVPLILKRFRQAVLAAACSGRLTEEWREERGRAEAWREVALEDLLREPLRNGHSAKQSADGKGVPTFSLSAFTNGDFSDTNVKMTVADPAKVRDLWAEPDDIYVERSNTPELVGTARLYDGPTRQAIVPDLVIRVRVNKEEALPRFVEHCLRSKAGHDYFIDRAQGTAGSMPKIDQGAVMAFPIALPPFDEQTEVVRQVDKLFALAHTIERKVQAATARADKLPQAILSKAFSGELVPTEADLARAEGRTYETATELLARVASEAGERVDAGNGRRAPKSGRASKRRAG